MQRNDCWFQVTRNKNQSLTSQRYNFLWEDNGNLLNLPAKDYIENLLDFTDEIIDRDVIDVTGNCFVVILIFLR